jgi:hypothetical protein
MVFGPPQLCSQVRKDLATYNRENIHKGCTHLWGVAAEVGVVANSTPALSAGRHAGKQGGIVGGIQGGDMVPRVGALREEGQKQQQHRRPQHSNKKKQCQVGGGGHSGVNTTKQLTGCE